MATSVAVKRKGATVTGMELEAQRARDRVPTLFDPDLIGRAVVKCPGCGEERWYGYGACRSCGTFLDGVQDA